MLPFGSEVHSADSGPVDVVARLSVRLRAGRCILVGLVVELDVQLGALGQLLVEADEELGVPTLCRTVGRLHVDATAAVLTSTQLDDRR